jgi:hypothetical protein
MLFVKERLKPETLKGCEASSDSIKSINEISSPSSRAACGAAGRWKSLGRRIPNGTSRVPRFSPLLLIANGCCSHVLNGRSKLYGTDVRKRLKSMGIAEVLTAPQSPWQNAYAERLDRIDRTRVFESFHHSEQSPLEEDAGFIFSLLPPITPHLALTKQCPVERQAMKDGAIVAIAEVGGRHHRYERVAA